MSDTRIEVDDSLYGIAEVSRGYLGLERRRTRFLILSIVIALLMNVGWLVAAALRDRSRTKTINDLSYSVGELSRRNEVLQLTQESLARTVQDSVEQKKLLEDIGKLLDDFRNESRRSLDCVALYVSGQPSKSPNCDDVNKRLISLIAGRVVFPTTTIVRAITTTSPSTTTTRPTIAPTTTSITTPHCRGISLLGLCIGG